ncbi:MAG TPA: 4'-phosphopantetheinyl transferase superfamily protein [Myxococcota bacterium]|nr:4'-phosphopantetheinyl transferase superfamily protein [Myxococcota bacterium]
MKPLFPELVVYVEADDSLVCSSLHPAEAALAARMGAARRAEFALGRACARRALAKLGIENEPLLRGEARDPRWPPGVIGSLTHTEGFCAAAVARRGELLALGLDAESAPISPRAARRVLDAEERARIESLGGATTRDFATLAFSAKESVFKAVFPLCGRRLGFRDAAIEIDPAAQGFRVVLRAGGEGALPPGARIEGRYALTPTCVVTSVVVYRE